MMAQTTQSANNQDGTGVIKWDSYLEPYRAHFQDRSDQSPRKIAAKSARDILIAEKSTI
jgi:hypothetical protein